MHILIYKGDLSNDTERSVSLKKSFLLQFPRNETDMGKHQAGTSRKERKTWPRALIVFSMGKARQGRGKWSKIG